MQGTSGKSGVMQVVMKDPPTFVTRAEAKYVRSVGGKVEFPCAGAGEPTPTVSWRRVDGKPLPRRRHKGKQVLKPKTTKNNGRFDADTLINAMYLSQAFFWAILWRLIEAVASEGLSFLPIP